MVATPAIRSLIRDGKTHQLNSDIQTGSQHGMESLDHNLLELVQQEDGPLRGRPGEIVQPRRVRRTARRRLSLHPANARAADGAEVTP